MTETEPIPFYERTLDSFSDEVITKVRETEPGLWYASLDSGPDGGPISFPDFARAASTPEGAIRLCAAWIRADQRGEGKFAPHHCLVPTSYDFRWKLCKWWTDKERASS